MKTIKRKVCFVITSEIHYARNVLILRELRKRDDVELQIVVSASAALERHSNVFSLLKEDKFVCNSVSTSLVEGGNPVAMAKTIGLGLLDFATLFENLKPDVLLLRGDRYEILAPAIAAVNLNIPIAHIEGGDLSGTIDESVRHAVTKLSHIHFATNTDSKNRIIRMGESPKYVFNYGSPELEFVAKNSFKITNKDIHKTGVGESFDITKPYLLVMNHPVTTEYSMNRTNTEILLKAIKDIDMQVIWFWPNVDAGTDHVSKAIRIFREKEKPKNFYFINYINPNKFYAILQGTACLVGNSSSGIKEASYFGTPVVNIGSRQAGRMRSQNVIDVENYSHAKIIENIQLQLKHKRYLKSSIYVKKDTAKKIAKTMATIPLYTQKRFYDEKV